MNTSEHLHQSYFHLSCAISQLLNNPNTPPKQIQEMEELLSSLITYIPTPEE
jgi:hypothetical protein